MPIDATILKWGNSYGIRLSKKDVHKLHLKQNEKVSVEIKHKNNPLEELYGSAKIEGKITIKDLKKIRKELDTKF